jgi:hypothetical protein
MRRRRRRGQSLSPRATMILAGVAGALVIAGFFYFVNVADQAEPAQTETVIELPDAFKS